MRSGFGLKIARVLLVIAVLLILVGGIDFAGTRYIRKISHAILKENVSSILEAKELEASLINQRGLVSNYFLSNDPAWIRLLDQRKQEFSVLFKHAQSAAFTEKEKIILQRLSALYESYDMERDKAIELYQAGDISEAVNIRLGLMHEKIDQLNREFEAYVSANMELIDKAEEFSKTIIFGITGLIWVTVVFVLFFGFFAGKFITRQINEQLLLSAKLASLGQLSVNIAHQLNNPLTGILNNIQLVNEDMRQGLDYSPVKLKEILSEAEESALRCKNIITSLLGVYRLDNAAASNISLNALIDKVVNLIEPEMRLKKISIVRQLTPGLPGIKGNAQLLQEAVINLIFNAGWAIEAKSPQAGGKITIETRYVPKKNAVDLYISDTGIGIPKANLKKIFEPLFTTKPAAEGTGLGLTIVYDIIKKHKGNIGVESREGRGAVFKLSLPCILSPAVSG